MINEEVSHIAYFNRKTNKPELLYTEKYVDELERENKQLKERINKVLKMIENFDDEVYEDDYWFYDIKILTPITKMLEGEDK